MTIRARSGASAALATLLLTGLWASGFAEGNAPIKIRPLRFGVITEQANEPDRVLRVYADFLHQLRGRLAPMAIEVAPLVIAKDLTDLSQRLLRGEVDLVAETVFATLDLQVESQGAVAPRLAIVRNDRRQYHTVFFTNRNTNIRTLEDLRGRTLVLQAQRSTSAFAVPKAELARSGISLFPAGQPAAPRGSTYYVFAGAELNQAIWVLKGRGDAGAFNDGDWDRVPSKIREGLVIFHETEPLLRGLLSFRTRLDPEIRAACEEALLNMHKDTAGRAALLAASGITRFERLTTKDLAGLGEWRQALRNASRGHR
ncbi:MAG: phosphate/phosphite/phosphonate ABC transporter substrate-binding protein [Vicinamibacteria bacterium]|nr:phosphate/phosphite/phosphonate ABC transporter substrate-binding protein [Vicinamibacteria bacterium]